MGRNEVKKQTLHIKWIRSGIGFPRRQKEFVRSLGLTRLNEVVERPDTAAIRGLVARISHLVEIAEPAPEPAWRGVPEYVVQASAAPVKAKPAPTAPKAKAIAESPATTEEKPKAAKSKAEAKPHPAGSAKKSSAKAEKKTEKEKKPKAASAKDSKTTKKGKK